MADFQKKDMTGVLFRNDRKEKETHPDWAGYIVINGVEHWLNCWEKNGSKGLFFSLAAKPKQERSEDIKRGYQGRPADDGDTRGGKLDDEIPFSPEFR